ncbi:hypothetical protein AVW13_14175 [Brevibacterium casei]|uniref:Uncharacterized protein n=1 Tax=Brevibacterium casei TaxID=33889 RepID=A0AB34XPV7_9MICO|nr:hypothetical protein AVW13_14175 [Brevibacterium casei]
MSGYGVAVEFRFQDIDLFINCILDDVMQQFVCDLLFALGNVPRPPTVLFGNGLGRTVHEYFAFVHPNGAGTQFLNHFGGMVDQ